MTQILYDYMQISESCLLNKTIFKNLFEKHCELDAIDKVVLKDDIEKIRWLYAFKPETLNIPVYKDDARDYEEVVVIQIDLTNPNRVNRIVNFVNKAIPYPIVLVFSFANTIAISVTDKRTNQADSSKWVVDDSWTTEWFNPYKPNEIQHQFMQDMALKNLSFVNFYVFYKDIKDRVLAFIAATRSGYYQTKTTQRRDEVLMAIGKLEKRIKDLQAKLKKETQFNKQMELSGSIQAFKQEIKQLEQDL